MKNGFSNKKIFAASIIGCVATLQMGAFSVTLQTLCSGITALPFGVFVGTMQPIHLAIGFVEGLITAAVLVFVHESRPELLFGADKDRTEGKERLQFKTTIIVLGVCALVIGGFLSQFASGDPDGLEWSMEQVAGTTELEAEGGAYETAAGIQEVTSLLPDYAFIGSESAVGTSFSGILGAVLVMLICVAAGYGFKFYMKKRQ